MIMKPDSTKEERWFGYPHLLPDGQNFMFSVWKNDNSFDLVVQTGNTRKQLLHGPPNEFMEYPIYSPSGYILYQRGAPNSGIWAVPFSLSSLTVTGAPFLVAPKGFRPSVSSDGTLVYETGTTGSRQLVWMDRNGKVEGTIGQPQPEISMPALSPDGRRVAVKGTESGNDDIWIHEGNTKTHLTL